MALIIGVAGTIAAGKSTILALLRERGAEVCEGDALIHALYEPGTPSFARVVEAFGPEVVGTDGRIDRKALSARVIGNRDGRARSSRGAEPGALPKLTTALGGIGPSFKAVADGWRRELPDEGIGVLEYWGLMEPGFAIWCDCLWLVTASAEVAAARLVESRGMTPEEAIARAKAMPAIDFRLSGADWFYLNDGTREAFAAAVHKELARVTRLHRERRLPPSRFPAWWKAYIAEHRAKEEASGIILADRL